MVNYFSVPGTEDTINQSLPFPLVNVVSFENHILGGKQPSQMNALPFLDSARRQVPTTSPTNMMAQR